MVVDEWELGAPAPNPYRPEQLVFPMTAGPLSIDVVCSTGPDGTELSAALRAYAKPRAKRPPLYGVMHVEMGRMLLQPLTVFGDDGPQHLMISEDNIDLASLMKTLDFTS